MTLSLFTTRRAELPLARLTLHCFLIQQHNSAVHRCAILDDYPQFVRFGRDGDRRPVQSQVLFVAVDIAHQLHQRQGGGGAHGQAVILRPGERVQTADRGQEGHDGVPFNRNVLMSEEPIVPGAWLDLNNYICELGFSRFRWTGGRHVSVRKELTSLSATPEEGGTSSAKAAKLWHRTFTV